MRLTCQQDEFSRALQLVIRGAAPRSTLPILSGILLDAEGDRLWVRGTDLEIAIECGLPAGVKNSGKVVVNGKTLTEFVRRLPSGTVEVALDDTSRHLRVDAAKTSIQLPVMAAEEFPALPAPALEGLEINISSNKLREMVRRTIFATLAEDSRPFLSSILWEIDENRMRLVATDINRLALCETKVETDRNVKVLIPVRALRETIGIFTADDEAKLTVRIGTKQVFFIGEGVTFSTRLIESDFPQYDQVIPKNFVAEMVVPREALVSALERASLVTDTVKLTINDGVLYLRGDDAATGQTFEEIAVTGSGQELQIVLSPQYLLDFLKAVNLDKVRFSFTGATDRVLIRPFEVDDYQYIVMPYQVNL